MHEEWKTKLQASMIHLGATPVLHQTIAQVAAPCTWYRPVPQMVLSEEKDSTTCIKTGGGGSIIPSIGELPIAREYYIIMERVNLEKYVFN